MKNLKNLFGRIAVLACVVAAISFVGCKSDDDDGNLGGGTQGGKKPNITDIGKGVEVTNASVKIVKADGRLNSAFIIFEQLSGASAYDVLCDGNKIDEELIRYYDKYVYYTKEENPTTLQVTWTKHEMNNVVRADALGLKAGQHELKVCKRGESDYSTATMEVLDNDRQGFCFTGTDTPGAYKADGTLKDGTIVIYLTEANKKTLTVKLGGTEYTGMVDIAQAIKTKNTGTTPVDIRVIGKLTLDGLVCSDMKDAYALGVKQANFVTIEGVGDDATMAAGVAAFQSDYIEIKNLGLMKWGGGKDGDGVSLKKSKYVWVHNNDFFYGDAGSDADQVKGDGSMDLKDDSQYVTISYNHFWDSGKMSLCGMKSESGPNYITYHHNWFDHSDSRHPRIRTMTVHVYNNYFDGNAKYGVGVTYGGNAFVEGNFFRNAHDPMMISKQGTDAQGNGTFSGEKGGQIKSWNNKFEQKNTNGVKFQFITNKRDYTNNKELGEYKEWTETLGKDNGDGTWTIYKSEGVSGMSENSLIYLEDAVVKGDGAYYQASKTKTFFTLSVPANTTKIIFNAKTGSSGDGKTATIKLKKVVEDSDESKDYLTSDSIGNSSYENIEFAISGLTDETLLEVVNGSGSNSLNIKSVTLVAASGWETKLTSGADPSNIDAYEVDSRDQTIPDTVKSRSGNFAYSNFDTTMGDSGLGLTSVPTGPDKAKSDILKLAGRIEPSYAWNFKNATDDAKYEVDTVLNDELVAYIKSGPAMKNVQGASPASGTGGGSSGNTGSGNGDTGNNEGNDPTDPGAVIPGDPSTAISSGTYTFSAGNKATSVSDSANMTMAWDGGTAQNGYYKLAKNGSASVTMTLKNVLEGTKIAVGVTEGNSKTDDKYTLTTTNLTGSASPYTVTSTGNVTIVLKQDGNDYYFGKVELTLSK